MKLSHFISVAILLLSGGLAQAEDRTYLNKSEVEQLFAGKVVTFARLSDGQKIKWAINKGGMLFGNNLSGGSKDIAAWEIKEDGAMCVKWRGNSKDGCFYYFMDADKVMRTEKSQSNSPIESEILSIQ